jgi:hypothetical protein
MATAAWLYRILSDTDFGERSIVKTFPSMKVLQAGFVIAFKNK